MKEGEVAEKCWSLEEEARPRIVRGRERCLLTQYNALSASCTPGYATQNHQYFSRATSMVNSDAEIEIKSKDMRKKLEKWQQLWCVAMKSLYRLHTYTHNISKTRLVNGYEKPSYYRETTSLWSSPIQSISSLSRWLATVSI